MSSFERVAAFATDLADIVERYVHRELGMPPNTAARAGQRISKDVLDAHGGQVVYIGTGFYDRIAERDAALLAEYRHNGGDVAAAARKVGLTTHNAYKRLRLAELADPNPDANQTDSTGDPT